MTDKAVWKCIQLVSHSQAIPCPTLIIDKAAWNSLWGVTLSCKLFPAKLGDWQGCMKCIQEVSHSQAIPDQVGWLKRLCENASSEWIALRLFLPSWMINKAVWKHIHLMSCSQPQAIPCQVRWLTRMCENASGKWGAWPVTTHEQEIYRSMLAKILLEHCLHASNSILITICF